MSFSLSFQNNVGSVRVDNWTNSARFHLSIMDTTITPVFLSITRTLYNARTETETSRTAITMTRMTFAVS